MKIRFTIYRLPFSLNKLYRMHWAKRHRYLQEWIDEVFFTCRKDNLIPEVPFKKAKVTIRYYFQDRRRRDKENYAPKAIVDALRYSGIIEDDSVKHINLNWEILQGRPGRCEIEVEEENDGEG